MCSFDSESNISHFHNPSPKQKEKKNSIYEKIRYTCELCNYEEKGSLNFQQILVNIYYLKTRKISEKRQS